MKVNNVAACLYILDGDLVCAELDAFAWAAWMENTDSTVEFSEGFTPTGRWIIQTVFYGVDVSRVTGAPRFFGTQLASGANLETMKPHSDVMLSQTMVEAMANHRAMLFEARQFKGTQLPDV